MANSIVAIEGKFGPREIYGVRLGGQTTTDQIVQAWHKAGLYVSRRITQANFPLEPHAIEDVEIEVINPGCSFSKEEGLEFLEAAGLDRPTDEHALRFAEQCGRTMTGKKSHIIFLHKAWPYRPGGSHYTVCVCRYPDHCELYLAYLGHGLSADCVLAGVRRRK